MSMEKSDRLIMIKHINGIPSLLKMEMLGDSAIWVGVMTLEWV